MPINRPGGASGGLAGPGLKISKIKIRNTSQWALFQWFGKLQNECCTTRGNVMLQANAQVEGSYAVLSGLIKVQTVPVKGRSSSFLGVACGEWFGECSALKAEPRRYEVMALRDTELLCLPLAEFDHLRATII